MCRGFVAPIVCRGFVFVATIVCRVFVYVAPIVCRALVLLLPLCVGAVYCFWSRDVSLYPFTLAVISQRKREWNALLNPCHAEYFMYYTPTPSLILITCSIFQLYAWIVNQSEETVWIQILLCRTMVNVFLF